MPRGVMAELVQPVLALHGLHSPQGGQRSRTSRPLPFFKNSLKKILFTIFFFFFYISSLCEIYLEERIAASKKSEPDSSWKGPCPCFSTEDLGGV